MAQLLVQHRGIFQLVKGAVDLDALKALLAQIQEFLAVFALAVAHDGGQQIGAGAFGHCHHGIDHVLHLLRGDRQAGRGRKRRADAGKQQPHVIVDLGDRADGRAGVFRGGLLFDGNGRGQSRDMVDIGLAHHVEELARIGRQRFHIPPLTFGIDGIEGEAGFARAGQAGDHHQLVARDADVHVFQIVLARAAHFDEFLLGHAQPP